MKRQFDLHIIREFRFRSFYPILFVVLSLGLLIFNIFTRAPAYLGPYLLPSVSGFLMVTLGAAIFYFLWPRMGLTPLMLFHGFSGLLLQLLALGGQYPELIYAGLFLGVFLPPLIFHFAFLLSELLLEVKKYRNLFLTSYVISFLFLFPYLYCFHSFYDIWKILTYLWAAYTLSMFLFFWLRLTRTQKHSSFELDRYSARCLRMALTLGWLLPLAILLAGILITQAPPTLGWGPIILLFPLSLFVGFIPAKRHQMETYIIQSEKRKSFGDLLGGLAHELNNPLNFVYSNLEPLEELIKNLYALVPKPNDHAATLSKDAEHILKDMEDGLNRAKNLIENFRQFPERRVSQKEKLNLNELLDRCIDLLAHKWKNRITLERVYDRLEEIRGISLELEQVFTNILANACDATPDGGAVTVKTKKNPHFVKISIRDTGAGIPKEDLGRIFDPFFSTKEQGKGTGLGLAITLQIVKNHQGNIEVKSDPGKGTEFLIQLPYSE